MLQIHHLKKVTTIATYICLMLYWLQRVEILTYIVVSDGKEFKGKGRKNNKTNQPNKKTIM